MLKRKDLVEQFQDLVKQEIVNHNDQILASHVALDKMKRDLVEFGKSLEIHCNSTVTEVFHQATKCSEISQDFKHFKESITRRANDIENLIRDNGTQFSAAVLRLKSKLDDLEKNIWRIDSLETDVKQLYKKTENEILTVHDRIGMAIRKSSENLSAFKKELSEQPCKATEVKQEIESKIEANRIDGQGILREMRLIKNSHMVIEKTLEALWTRSENANKKIEELSCHRQGS